MPTSQAPSLVYSYDASGATIKIKASDLGGTKKFNFSAVAGSGVVIDASGNPNYSQASIDFAPDLDHGTYAYQVLTTLKLSVSTFRTVPATPAAGGTLAASMAATENDTGGPVGNGAAVACRATVGGAPVTVKSHALANGVATCVWKLPKSAKGKKLSGTVTVTLRGAKAAKSFLGQSAVALARADLLAAERSLQARPDEPEHAGGRGCAAAR